MRIEKEDIDVIDDEAVSTTKHTRKGRKDSALAPKPDSTNGSRALRLNTVGDTTVGRKYSGQAAYSKTTASESHATKLPDPAGLSAPVLSTCSDRSFDSTRYEAGEHLLEDEGLTSLLQTTTGVLSQINEMKRKGNIAEQDYIRQKLKQALSEKARLQTALDDCKSEINRLRDEDIKITMRMQDVRRRDREEESDEERKIHDDAMKAIQRLHDIRSQKLETRKRRVSQWPTGSSPPTRETKRTR